MSIAVNELRIGNMFWESYGGYKIVDGINHHKNDIPSTVDAHGIGYKAVGRYGCDEISPIPLTPEILDKCGFGYKLNGFNHEFRRGKCEGEYLDYYLLNRHEPASYYKLIHVIGEVVLVDKIWYLHQLQNLYFALTGEELPINLK
jgi:hypothetical protein